MDAFPITDLDLARTLHNLLSANGLDFDGLLPPDAAPEALAGVVLLESADGRCSLRLTLSGGQQFSLAVAERR